MLLRFVPAKEAAKQTAEGIVTPFLQVLGDFLCQYSRVIVVNVCTAAIKLVEELQPHLDTMSVGVVLKPFDIDHLLAEIDRVWASQESS